MHYRALLSLAVLLPSFSLAAPAKRQNPDYFNPYENGGSLLNIATQDNPPLGEPLNVIISANSSPDVLTGNGFLNYVRSLGMSNECLNQHQGAPQLANLGNGAGNIPQEAEYRDDFGVSIFGLGTCLESLVGGNHLRVYRQSGPDHPDHAVRSLSEAEVKAAVDAALARSSPSGNTTTSLLGVKKLANGNLRLRTTSEDARDALVKESGTWLPALAEHAQLVRDLYTVEIRAVPVAFRPSEAYAVRGLCQANAHVFPDVSNIVTIRWLRELKDGHDKQTSSLLVVVDGQDTFARAVHHGVAIHGRLCDVSPYIPSPTQCYFCQSFGHTVTACPRKKNNLTIICARCAGPHATSACSCPHSPACSSRPP